MKTLKLFLAFCVLSAVAFAQAPVNVLQLNGTTADTNSGTKSAGTLRMVLATDQPTLTTPFGMNLSQVNGVTPLMGNGITGTGSTRVTLSSDNAALANWGLGASGSAVPSGAQYFAGNGSGNLLGVVTCDNSSPINISTATTSQIIAISGTGGRTYICAVNLVVGAADNVALISGSGTACASNQAGLAGGTSAASGWNFPANSGISLGSGIGMVFKTVTTNNEICLVTSATAQVSGSFTWTQF